MAVVFKREGNPMFPLPPDYESLTLEGRKKARVNACSLRGTPSLGVAAWKFLREYYLFPTPPGMWYKHGVVKSPLEHARIIWDWNKYRLTLNAEPRSLGKSTLVREHILKNLLTRPYYHTVLYLAKSGFVTDCLGMMMKQILYNDRIIEDFGPLKPGRNEGVWNHEQIELRNGAALTGVPLLGVRTGPRPHEIFFDDVEKDDSLILCPSELIEGMRDMLFNVVFPMAEAGVPIRILGTLLNHRTFIYWMQHTKDPRIADYWHRALTGVNERDASGKLILDEHGRPVPIWKEKMGLEWQARQRRMMGEAAWAAQYENDPGTEESRVLQIHPELCTYLLEGLDDAATSFPLRSDARVIAYQVKGFQDQSDGNPFGGQPIPRRIVRRWGDVVSSLNRFIMVDYARTQRETSDFSVIHVMGLENSHDFANTLWSLDMWSGKCRLPELIQYIYLLSLKWDVPYVGVEEYPLQHEYYARISENLPSLYGRGETVPSIIPVKFPSSIRKPDKIRGLEWRFSQYRVKLPLHRKDTHPYNRLWYQIENFTDGMDLLRHDDEIDTLAMSQFLTNVPARGPDIKPRPTALERIRSGEAFADSVGIPVFSGLNASEIPDDVLHQLMDERRERLEAMPTSSWIPW